MHRLLRRAPGGARCAVVVLYATLAGWAFAGEAATPASAAAPDGDSAADLGSACRCVPAGTLVQIEILEPLVSDERKPGDGFGLRLAEPIVLDGTVVVPAGTPGHGEVIHAAKARGGGQAGELTLAARYLELDGRRIPLRGMKFGVAGTDRASSALATAIAIGVFAQFIHGGEVRIPPGTRATARLASALDALSIVLPAATVAPSGGNPHPSAPEPATESLQE